MARGVVILGQNGDDESFLSKAANVVAAGIESAVGGVATGIGRLISGDAPAEAATQDPGAVGADEPAAGTGSAAGPRATSKGGAGSSYAPEEAPYASPGSSASVWPWVLGLALVAGGGVVAYKLIKGRRR